MGLLQLLISFGSVLAGLVLALAIICLFGSVGSRRSVATSAAGGLIHGYAQITGNVPSPSKFTDGSDDVGGFNAGGSGDGT